MSTAASPDASPGIAAGLLRQFDAELARFVPFGQMTAADRAWLLSNAEQRYFEPDALMLAPEQGAVTQWFVIRRGSVLGTPSDASAAVSPFEYEAGDVFPVGAVLAGRAVTASYRAVGDVFAWVLDASLMQALVARSTVFADFANGRVLHLLARSQQALRQASADRAMAVHSLERPLAQLMRARPLSCSPQTALQQALSSMHQRRVGSMLVVDDSTQVLGILTRYDVLDRVTLAQLPLSTPIGEVMTRPVYTLDESQTAQDAALLMSEHGIRHVPVLRDGALVGIVSERDLFALQRLSINQISGEIRAADSVPELAACAAHLRRLAHDLLAQGVQAKQLTALVSHLNDTLTSRLVQLTAAKHGIALSEFCWVALGSEGRGEQTIATDQDNALVIDDTVPDERLPALQAMARDVNESLDACGYPLCQGGIMAGQDACFLRLSAWKARFAQWTRVGEPEHLLAAAIYFDFRALAGRAALAKELREAVTPLAAGNKRFLRQLASVALEQDVPLNWRGGLDTSDHHGTPTIDLKLQGTALVVAAARLYALAHGAAATATVERLRACAAAMGAPSRESEAWVTAFEFLQMLRLRVQLELAQAEGTGSQALAVDSDEPNRIAVRALNDVDRRVLKESLRAIGQLLQRLRLDHAG